MFELSCRQEERHICHVDADAFFAAVEQVLNPRLKGKPVLVGGPSETSGIVSACSYEAKRLGVKTAMPMYLAKRKCPSAVVVAGNFDVYRDFSRRMYEIFMKYTPEVEMASIDEAYLDISGFEKVYRKNYVEIARSILMDVYKKLGISVSCGLSSSKTVSKVASSNNKPHKLTVVPFGKERAFLADLPLNAIPGIGVKTCEKLERFGFKKVVDVAKLSVNGVLDLLGFREFLFGKSVGG